MSKSSRFTFRAEHSCQIGFTNGSDLMTTLQEVMLNQFCSSDLEMMGVAEKVVIIAFTCHQEITNTIK